MDGSPRWWRRLVEIRSRRAVGGSIDPGGAGGWVRSGGCSEEGDSEEVGEDVGQ